MQHLAWEVVKNYPDCGLYEEGTMPVAAPEFLKGRQSRSASHGRRRWLLKHLGAWFRYTLDGTEPTRIRGYVYCGVIHVPEGATLKAIAYKSGMADSPVAEKGP